MAKLNGDTLHHFKESCFDRDIGISGVMVVDPLFLVVDGVVRDGAVECAQHVGQECGKAVVYRLYRRDIQAGVPQELPAFHEHLREIALWLLDERIGFEDGRLWRRRVAYIANLQIAVARFGATGAYAHREETFL